MAPISPTRHLEPPAHDDKLLALRATIFDRLTATQLEDVARVSEIRHFDAGTPLCLQGAFSQESFVLAKGSVSIELDCEEVARRGPGDIVGDWALFGDGRRSATIRALTDVDTVVIDSREVDSLLMAVPEAADVLGPQQQRATD